MNTVSVALNNGCTATAVPNAQGIYEIPLAWRYTLAEPGVILDDLLKEQGIVYVRRLPGLFHEEWKLAETPLANTTRYNYDGDGIPKDFTSPTF